MSNACKWLEDSLRERKKLLLNFDNHSVDSEIYRNFEMEYYLSLVEYLDYIDRSDIDDLDYIMFLQDIDTYISTFESMNNNHAYVNKIARQREKLE